MVYGGWMKRILRKLYQIIYNSPLCRPLYHIKELMNTIRVFFVKTPHISPEDIRNVEKNVTFIYKSFNRQKLAKRLYKSIRSFYPNVRIIIADDSREPLDLPCVIHLPFNSGLSKGLIAALEQVQTPFVMRMDDDEVLTTSSKIHEQLSYLQTHSQVDLVGIQLTKKSRQAAADYSRILFNKPLLIPAGTDIAGKTVVYKSPNTFLARTDKLRLVGYDPNIRMIDHQEFFYRAAGVIVSVQCSDAYVLHQHNRFDKEYLKYRRDINNDVLYINLKHNGYRNC